MSIKFIALREPVTIPGRISTISLYNATEHGKLLRVEETPEAFLFICGQADDKGEWKPTGDVVEVYRHMVKWVTRTRPTAKQEVKKP